MISNENNNKQPRIDNLSNLNDNNNNNNNNDNTSNLPHFVSRPTVPPKNQNK